jgi:hypothetical protein
VQQGDATWILHPLHKLSDFAESWRDSLELNDSIAQEGLVRQILEDAALIKPKARVFRRQ